MRQKIQKQLPLVETGISHDHALELKVISDIIARHPEIGELVYMDLISGLKDPEAGRRGLMTAEQVFRALLIKQMNGFSYAELAFHLADSRSYRLFCGFGFCDETPSDSTLQRDFKKLQPATLERINDIVVKEAKKQKVEDGKSSRIDCTVMKSNIHEPKDSSLLFDGVRVLCRLTQKAKEEFGIKTPDHTLRAQRRSLGISNAKKDSQRKKLYRDLLKTTENSVRDAVRVAAELVLKPCEHPVAAMCLVTELKHYIPLVKKVIAQTTRRVINGEKVPPQDKVVSIFEPHTDIIIKDRRETLYGHKLTFTGGASGMITDLVIETGNPADATLAARMIDRQKEKFGRVPQKAAFDGGFASKANLAELKSKGVKDVMFSKTRGMDVKTMTKSEWVFRRLRDFRAGIEGIISYVKRCFGMRSCNWRGFASFQAYAWSSVVAANLMILARHLIQ